MPTQGLKLHYVDKVFNFWTIKVNFWTIKVNIMNCTKVQTLSVLIPIQAMMCMRIYIKTPPLRYNERNNDGYTGTATEKAREARCTTLACISGSV